VEWFDLPPSKTCGQTKTPALMVLVIRSFQKGTAYGVPSDGESTALEPAGFRPVAPSDAHFDLFGEFAALPPVGSRFSDGLLRG
jgi:hypothetical protein